jgi:hypothetical protein
VRFERHGLLSAGRHRCLAPDDPAAFYSSFFYAPDGNENPKTVNGSHFCDTGRDACGMVPVTSFKTRLGFLFGRAQVVSPTGVTSSSGDLNNPTIVYVDLAGLDQARGPVESLGVAVGLPVVGPGLATVSYQLYTFHEDGSTGSDLGNGTLSDLGNGTGLHVMVGAHLLYPSSGMAVRYVGVVLYSTDSSCDGGVDACDLGAMAFSWKVDVAPNYAPAPSPTAMPVKPSPAPVDDDEEGGSTGGHNKGPSVAVVVASAFGVVALALCAGLAYWRHEKKKDHLGTSSHHLGMGGTLNDALLISGEDDLRRDDDDVSVGSMGM